MRTHTALHVLCGVIWNEWQVPVTGGNMEPLRRGWTSSSIRCPRASAATVEELVNAELAADRPIEVSFLPRDTAVHDEDLIRTKVNLIPESVRRSASSTSSASTSRPTAAPTCAPPARSAASGS